MTKIPISRATDCEARLVIRRTVAVNVTQTLFTRLTC